MKFRWFITKKMLVGLIGLLVAALFLMALTSCLRIPVTVHPPFDDNGKPKALPTAPTGAVDPQTGRFIPPFPVSDEAPTPPTDWWPYLQNALLVALGLLTGTGGGMVLVRRAKTALRIACDLADQNAVAETDQDVERNKMIAAQQQAALGVLKLTQAVRGK